MARRRWSGKTVWEVPTFNPRRAGKRPRTPPKPRYRAGERGPLVISDYRDSKNRLPYPGVYGSEHGALMYGLVLTPSKARAVVTRYWGGEFRLPKQGVTLRYPVDRWEDTVRLVNDRGVYHLVSKDQDVLRAMWARREWERRE